jgi:hypothetical protein
MCKIISMNLLQQKYDVKRLEGFPGIVFCPYKYYANFLSRRDEKVPSRWDNIIRPSVTLLCPMAPPHFLDSSRQGLILPGSST